MEYPHLLVQLAQAFQDGEDVVPALYDALVEAGYPSCAKRCFYPDLNRLPACVNKTDPAGKPSCKTIAFILGYESIIWANLSEWDEWCKSAYSDVENVSSQ